MNKTRALNFMKIQSSLMKTSWIKALVLSLICLSTLKSQAQTANLIMPNFTANCGDQIIVPVTLGVKDFDAYQAIDFSLFWNTNAFQVINVTNIITGFNAALGPNNPPPYTNGSLTFSGFSFSPKNYPAGTLLFNLVIQVVGGGVANPTISFSDLPTKITVGGVVNGVQFQPIPNINKTNCVVTITDNTPPVLVCPNDLTVFAPAGSGSGVVNNIYPIQASDNCGIAFLGYSYSGASNGNGSGDPSGTVFNAGNTTLTYTINDANNNFSTCNFEITVIDTALQVFTLNLPKDTLPCATTQFFIPVTTNNFKDITSLQFGMTWDEALLSFVGITNLNDSLNLNLANFGPTPFDNDSLTVSYTSLLGGITLPQNDTLFVLIFNNANGSKSGNISFIDYPGLDIEATQEAIPIPISIPVAIQNGSITLIDKIIPILVCPQDTFLKAGLNQFTVVVGGLTPIIATDNCGTPTLFYEFGGATSGLGQGDPSGSTFNLGTTNVFYTLVDNNGNSAFCSFDVILLDTVLRLIPTFGQIVCNQNKVKINITAKDFTALYSLQFAMHWDPAFLQFDTIENFDPQLQLTNSNFGPNTIIDTLNFTWFDFSGLDLPDGNTLFTLVFDLIAQPGSQSLFEILSSSTTPIEASTIGGKLLGVVAFNALLNISDTIKPELLCPNGLTVNLPFNQQGAIINNIAPLSATDDCGIASLNYNITGATNSAGIQDASGTNFNLGQSLVTYTVADFGGNSETCSFVINVVQDTFLLYVDTLKAQCQNSIIKVDINAKNYLSIASLQFGLTWDVGILQFDSVSNFNPKLNLINMPDPSANFGPSPTIDSLTFVWSNFQGVSLQDDETLFSLYFKVIANISGNTFVNFIDYPTTPIEVGAAGNPPFVIPYSILNGVIDIGDDIPPVITCSPDITVETNFNSCLANVVFSPAIATDNCDANVEVISNVPSGSTFNLGINLVVFTATDDAGNSSTCSFTITVVDNENPVIVCPPSFSTENDPGKCFSTIVLPGLIAATDNCDPSLTVVANQPNIKNYPVGNTQVIYAAVDNFNNTSTCTFIINVTDIELPEIIECPSDTTVAPTIPINNNCFAEVNWNLPLATDNCPNVLLGSNFTPGTLFPAGTTTVTYIATDIAGNQATCSFNINVLVFNAGFNDCPSDITVSAQGDSCKAQVFWTEPYFIDACGDTLDVFSNFGPGEVFLVGTTEIIYITVSNSVVLDTCKFLVTVDGKIPQVFDCPGDLSYVADSNCSAIVDFAIPFGNDVCGDTIVFTSNGIVPGDTLTAGIYTVIYSGSGFPSCAFNIAVIDDQKPSHGLCPPDQLIDVPDTVCGAFATWTEPLFTDNCDQNLTIFNNIDSGEFFPIGSTIVTYVAIDDFGNVDTCSFEVFIRESIPPVLVNCPDDITLNSLANACGNFVFFNFPTGTDNCDKDVAITSNFPPGFFPAGVTIVIFTATDDAGNTSTCSITVTILEVQAPVLICPSDVTVDGFGNVVTDPSNFIADVLISACNEPILFFETFGGIDNCSPFVLANQISPTTPSSGNPFPPGSYDLIFQATDLQNNSATCAVNILVEPYQLFANASAFESCLLDTITFSMASLPGLVTYSWELPGGTTVPGQIIQVAMNSLLSAGQYIAIASLDTCGTVYSDTINISILPPPVASDDIATVGSIDTLFNFNMLNNDISNNNLVTVVLGTSSVGSSILNQDNTITYIPTGSFSGTATVGYSICSVICPNVCDSATIVIDVFDNKTCKVPTVITPNDDDLNDILFIQCLDSGLYPKNRLVIYNEWGDQVFSAAPYQNDWRGTLEVIGGTNLPDGTYYYLFFESETTKDQQSGYLTIIR